MRSLTSRAQVFTVNIAPEDIGPFARTRMFVVKLGLRERREYIEAVKCLRQKPAKTPTSFASGVRNRMDDFTASHVNQTLFIHFSGWLLPWHRYFVWQYETALRDECGYMGSQPYWDWTEHNDNFTQHPLFDGSEYSLGGNGLYVPHGIANGTVPGVPDPQVVTKPPGTGGGCVVDGPFANITLNLGPVFPEGDPNRTGLEYSPHCMTRDFLQPLSQEFLTRESVAELLAQPTMADFRRTLDLGIHFAGHAGIGGDLSDVFTSPQDPAFYFHHGQIDRLWAMWQEQDLPSRLNATSDTQTYGNSPPSPNATIFDILEFGYVGGQVQMVDIMNTMGGALCYQYE
ncbi:hypothetical protein NM208_g3782 [Fusarium decemcellulare]|uniref:Uncharacterized protein n=1 Tax=Fusarium decemcellulare TaxID=57161 RepID=A0ACC1SMW6_9HYPO|nr:hypothetical protein NM208_g3782 [Fusarium decemcellulare]